MISLALSSSLPENTKQVYYRDIKYMKNKYKFTFEWVALHITKAIKK